jgi:hypothetical protein
MSLENWLTLGIMLSIGLGATLLALAVLLRAIHWIER